MSFKKNNERNSLFKEPVFKIANTLFGKPQTTFHLRGLAKETGLSTTAVSHALERLKQAVVIEKTAITTNVKANLESETYRHYKRIFNLSALQDSGFLAILQRCNPKTIVLFGSYAKGEDVETSDIDLLVITNSKGIPGLNLNEYERKLQRVINLTFLPSLEKSSSEFKNAVANGIVLQGYLTLL